MSPLDRHPFPHSPLPLRNPSSGSGPLTGSGSVFGVYELSQKISEARGRKPIVAIANSEAYSAGYYIASAADELWVTPTGMVGSIGVLATQVDWSQWNEKLGLGVTYIHAGKRFGHRKPPSPRTGFTGYDRCSRLPASAHVAVINMPPQTLRLLASELEILEALWRIGAATIIEVHRALPRRSGYTTVQTRLNRMVKKKLLRRSRSRPARYTPSITREQVSSSDLGLLLDKVSRGRVIPLVAHLVRDHSLTPAEIAELKQLIREAEARAAAEQDSRGET